MAAKPRAVGIICVHLCASAASMLSAGCGDARVELRAADAIETTANALQTALNEYTAEIDTADTAREAELIDAYTVRLLADHADGEAVATHRQQFTDALLRVRQDRAVETVRYGRSSDNVEALREIAGGLRQIGIASMTLEDEARRYLGEVLERAGKRQAPQG